MQQWIDRWNAYWFPETTTLPLSISRIGSVAAQLFLLFPSLEENLNLLQHNSDFIDPQPLIRAIAFLGLRAVVFTPTALTVFYWVTVGAGIAALVGLGTRLSMFIFALGNWFFISHKYSYADIHHPEAIFAIFLMLLAFSPSGGSLSLDVLIHRWRHRSAHHPLRRVETAVWPLKLAHVLLALTYFSTGLTKLLYGGLQWMNGYTLQYYIFNDALERGLPLGIWLSQQHTLCILLSVFTIAIEFFFFVSLIIPWTAPYFFVGAISFQLGLYVFAGHDFFQHIILLLLLLMFSDLERWNRWLGKGKLMPEFGKLATEPARKAAT